VADLAVVMAQETGELTGVVVATEKEVGEKAVVETR
jgi:hypothetical protein